MSHQKALADFPILIKQFCETNTSVTPNYRKVRQIIQFY